MWSYEDRKRYDRTGLRYPSDLTDAEWALVEPHIPPARRGGRKRTVDIRAVLQGVLYVLETGCQWRHLPKDFPPRSTVWDYFDLWSYDGTLDRIHDALYVAMRETEAREAPLTAAILDSRTAKSAEKGGANRRKPAMTRARRPRASSSTCSSTRLA
jgi:transposase